VNTQRLARGHSLRRQLRSPGSQDRSWATS
jgi:hypothetical protein